MISSLELLVGTVLICALAGLAVKLRAIDSSGALSGILISFSAFVAGMFAWFAMIVIFVGVSSGLTRYRYDFKRKLGFAQEKLGMRSWPNSLANGGVSVIASIGEISSHSEIFAIMFLTSVTAAMSDTLATEVGLLSHSTPRLITHPFRFVEPGTSGGISPLGDLAAILSATGMAILGIGFSVIREPKSSDIVLAGVAVVVGALAGVFFDSFLGATVQRVNRCVDCGKLTENSSHHGRPTLYIKGVKYFDNNVVNFVGILVGSLIAVGIYLLIVSP